MKVLIDTNIVLDLILNREPFVESASILFEMVEITKIQGFIAATTITNIFYIVRKAQGRQKAIEAIARLSTGLVICSVDSLVVRRALECNLKDFEDRVQLACAEINQLDAIVTRDISDFLGVELSILSIAELQQLIR